MKAGKVGKRDCYLILKTYNLATSGGVDKVVKNDRYMANKDEVINIICTVQKLVMEGREKLIKVARFVL